MKKKFVSVLLALTMSTTLSAGLTSTVFAEEAVSTASECSYDGGSGTQEDPYQISSTDSFLTFAANVNDGSNAGYADTYFLLTNDLDLTGIDWEPIGNMNDMENHSTLFLGSFDGGDHTISNLKYESDKYNCGAGLFGVNCGEVKNLAIEIRAERMYVGNDSAVLASVNDGLIENVMISGEIMGTNANVAGFVCLNNGTIRNSVSFVKVLQSESTEPAGVNAVAKTNDGTIENVFVDKEVTGASHLLSAADAALDAYCLASAEMKSAATYADFDQTIWTITEGQYPALKTL